MFQNNQEKTEFIEIFLSNTSGIATKYPSVIYKATMVLSQGLVVTKAELQMRYEERMAEVFDTLNDEKNFTLLGSLFRKARKSAEEDKRLYTKEKKFDIFMTDLISREWKENRKQLEQMLFQI